MKYVFAIGNNKGGTGKTTSTEMIAKAVSAKAGRVLVVDLDPQANLTKRFGYTPPRLHVGDLLLGEADWDEVAIELDDYNITLLPAGASLESDAMRMAVQPANTRFVKQAIAYWTGPVFIDCPPSLGILTANAMAAADGVIIAAEPEPDSITGAFRTQDCLVDLAGVGVANASLIGSIAFSANANTLIHGDGLRELDHLDAPIMGIVPQRQGRNFQTDNVGAYTPIADQILAILAGAP